MSATTKGSQRSSAMRLLPVLMVFLAVTALPAAAEARRVCGPAAPTIAKNAQVRVYALRGVAKTCSRAGSRSLTLGRAGRVLGVTLSGRYAAIRRAHPGGQSLRVYDLRLAQTRGQRQLRIRFTAVALDTSGLAAFIAPEGIGDTLDGSYPLGTAIEPTFVRVLGPIVAWRENGQLRIRSITDDRPFAIPRRDGTLYRQ